MEQYPNTSQILKEHIGQMGLSLRQLAKRSGLSHTHLADLFKGERSWMGISLGRLQALASGLNMPLEELITIIRRPHKYKAQPPSTLAQSQFVWIPLTTPGALYLDTKNPHTMQTKVPFPPKQSLISQGTIAIQVPNTAWLCPETLKGKHLKIGDYLAINTLNYTFGDYLLGYRPQDNATIFFRHLNQQHPMLYPIDSRSGQMTTYSQKTIKVLGAIVAQSG